MGAAATLPPSLSGVSSNDLLSPPYFNLLAEYWHPPPELIRVIVPGSIAAIHAQSQPSNDPFAIDKMAVCIYSKDVNYIHFVWDEVKNQHNIRKHGITFEEARSAFFDENARVAHDPEHSGSEDRFVLLGISRRLRLLLVCHCYRESEEQIRIISARRATKKESRQYGRT